MVPPTKPVVPGIDLDRVSVRYQRRLAVAAVSGRFAPGSLTAIVGPNGAGKSSLIKAIAGTIKPAAGRIDRGGCPQNKLAYLPQQSDIDHGFPITVRDTVMLGHWRRMSWWRSVDAAALEDCRAALCQVGLAGFDDRSIGDLSAGQFQRVLFARLIVQNAPLILLDEPFNALDARTTADLLDLVRTWHQEGRTIIAVLHDFDQVRAHFPETLLMARSLIAWGPSADSLSPAHLEAARNAANHWEDGGDHRHHGHGHHHQGIEAA